MHGQLGDGTFDHSSTPVAIDTQTRYSRIAVGDHHTCGITDTGKVKCWGLNVYGAIGDGSTPDFNDRRNTPTLIDQTTNYSQISSGFGNSCGITVGGELKCWGFNQFGQLGDGTYLNQSAPVLIDNQNRYTLISTNGTEPLGHTCGITTSSTLKCWGNNQVGQLGDSSINYSFPWPVKH